ncbi:MAG: glycosyltransferase family 2 protein [Metallosphaera sp.]
MNEINALYLIFGSITLSLSLIYFLLNSFLALNLREPKRIKVSSLSDVTVLIPVYQERADIFENVVSSVSRQGVKFIVVGDGSDEPYRSITTRYGGEFVYLEKRGGKRNALSKGISYVQSKFVLLLDSDTVLPRDGIHNMLTLMTEDVAGVSVNVRNVKTGTTYYMAELIERLKEATMRAVNRSGYAVLLNGKCSMYRTEVVKDFMRSEEFKNPKFMGRRSIIGDDKQLTNYVISRGYKAVVDFNTVALTYPPETIRKLYRQLTRWSRANYYFFFRELYDGTMLKRGPIYIYNFIYTTILPFLILGITVFDTIFLGRKVMDLNPTDYEMAIVYGGHFLLHLPSLLAKKIIFALIFGQSTFPFSAHAHVNYFPRIRFTYSVILIHLASDLTAIPFIYALWKLLHDEKLKTLTVGSLALLIQMIVSIYALITVWKQDTWLTR